MESHHRPRYKIGTSSLASFVFQSLPYKALQSDGLPCNYRAITAREGLREAKGQYNTCYFHTVKGNCIYESM